MAFIKNAWYVASWTHDLKDEPLPQTILNEKIVLWRGEDGVVRAAEDVCPHRFLPLSKGRIAGNDIQCGYHGLIFNGNGECVRAPTQLIRPDCRIREYPVFETMGMVWIWMGDTAIADISEIYDLPQYHQTEWGVAFGDALDVEANYLLLCDNLCDPTHVNYVHPSTLGNPEGINAPVTHESTSWGVVTERLTVDSAPTGFVAAFGGHNGRVDMWQRYLMYLPSVSIIDFGATAAGTGNWQEGGDARIQVYSCHFMTPVTETRTIDRWLHVRNFEPDDQAVGENISEQFRIAFAEDKEILEAVQKEETVHEGRLKIGLDLDASAGLFRLKINRLLKGETPNQSAK
ncbi:MAG: Toluene-4-sulfonate monooxygenase system iron-sulfur subunit TsaM1 [Alphaproteobacteria bacterium MarineAlpha11_Bin1]|nr:MAG: Toluene-4-sulfonate monooxygenase system iron-sulfur subunit TsaM1 [Alphaproteobacteria bacterium MarineAlpha11_Bin1]